MRFLVLGAGAMGGYFGAKLLDGGADVEFLVRPGRAAQLAEHGLVAKTHEGEIRLPVKTVQAGEIAHPYDVILLCCKAYDLDDALTALAPAVGPGSAILPFLNGVKHLEIMASRFGAEHVFGGLTTVNAVLEPNGEIVRSPVKINITMFGELKGGQSDRCHSIERAFSAAGVTVDVSETIMAPMWRKFWGFTSVATVATLCRSRAGAISSAPASPAFIDAVIEECTRVAKAEGYPPPQEDIGAVHGLFSQSDSKYGPSILVDMELGRKTEGEHTIGDLAERATRHGISAPILTAARCNLQVHEVSRPKV